jgi:hypothetical protein
MSFPSDLKKEIKEINENEIGQLWILVESIYPKTIIKNDP